MRAWSQDKIYCDKSIVAALCNYHILSLRARYAEFHTMDSNTYVLPLSSFEQTFSIKKLSLDILNVFQTAASRAHTMRKSRFKILLCSVRRSRLANFEMVRVELIFYSFHRAV